MNTDYRIEVSWDPADQVWVADVPELTFCTAHGPTPHQAVAEVERAVDAWLEAADALGRPAPPPSMPAKRA
jgi:predicted RNase H-like HicB family nuclease